MIHFQNFTSKVQSRQQQNKKNMTLTRDHRTHLQLQSFDVVLIIWDYQSGLFFIFGQHWVESVSKATCLSHVWPCVRMSCVWIGGCVIRHYFIHMCDVCVCDRVCVFVLCGCVRVSYDIMSCTCVCVNRVRCVCPGIKMYDTRPGSQLGWITLCGIRSNVNLDQLHTSLNWILKCLEFNLKSGANGDNRLATLCLPPPSPAKHLPTECKISECICN